MIGEGMNTLVVQVISSLKKRMIRRMKIEGENLVSVIELVISEGILMSSMVCIGSYYFKRHEKWTLLDSVYYSITTFTTIGFGDFVPLRRRRSLWYLWTGDKEK
ncbi:hypothetical protein ACOME3_001762 [Neoechinorhynchus agilis]